MTDLSFAAEVAARIFLVAMFPPSALEKIFDWKSCIAQAGGTRAAPAMLVAAILCEGLTPFCIVFGWYDRLAAFILAGFCVVTAFLYHPFWRYPNFRDFKSEAREHFWQFLKNFGLVGGLGLVIIAGSLADPIWVLQHPFSSSYADRTGGAR